MTKRDHKKQLVGALVTMLRAGKVLQGDKDLAEDNEVKKRIDVELALADELERRYRVGA
jgi:hypothetical protein